MKAFPATLNIRVGPTIRAALEKAASEDQRRVTDLARVILADWLRKRGLLAKRREL
jgi:hypothetical protein